MADPAMITATTIVSTVLFVFILIAFPIIFATDAKVRDWFKVGFVWLFATDKAFQTLVIVIAVGLVIFPVILVCWLIANGMNILATIGSWFSGGGGGGGLPWGTIAMWGGIGIGVLAILAFIGYLLDRPSTPTTYTAPKAPTGDRPRSDDPELDEFYRLTYGE